MLKIISLLFLLIFTLNARNININDTIERAGKAEKHVFLFLHRTDCGYCESMQEFTLDDETIKTLIKKFFVFIHINVSEDDTVIYKDFKGSGREFAKFIDYNIYPSSVFFDSSKEVVYAIIGYQDEDSFKEVLEYVKDRVYEKDEFDD